MLETFDFCISKLVFSSDLDLPERPLLPESLLKEPCDPPFPLGVLAEPLGDLGVFEPPPPIIITELVGASRGQNVGCENLGSALQTTPERGWTVKILLGEKSISRVD